MIPTNPVREDSTVVEEGKKEERVVISPRFRGKGKNKVTPIRPVYIKLANLSSPVVKVSQPGFS